jgi:peptide/nickel transport system permease protein
MATLTSAGHSAEAMREGLLTHRQPLAKALQRVGPVPWLVRFCGAWLVFLVVIAVFAQHVAPHDPMTPNLMARNLPPIWQGGNWTHPFGTDQIGQDLLSRTIYGARPSLQVGALAALISLTLGTSLGMIAGYFGGRIDSGIMLLADVQLSTPFLIVAIAAVAAFGQSLGLLILLAGLSAWMGFARTVRSQALSLRHREFIVASRALGAGNWHLLSRHILPNIASVMIVLTTIQLRSLILFEASMSFLGLGVPPPIPAWGSMISGGRDYLLTAWWISVLPGIAMMLTVLSVSFLGDWLRDVLDPTMRGR